MKSDRCIIAIKRQGVFVTAQHLPLEDVVPGTEMLMGDDYSRDFYKVFEWSCAQKLQLIQNHMVACEVGLKMFADYSRVRSALFYDMPLVKARFAEIAEEIKKTGAAIAIPSDVEVIVRCESMYTIRMMTSIHFTVRNGKLNITPERDFDNRPLVARGAHHIIGHIRTAIQEQYGVKITTKGSITTKANVARILVIAKMLLGASVTKKMIADKLEEYKRDLHQFESNNASEIQQKAIVTTIQAMMK